MKLEITNRQRRVRPDKTRMTTLVRRALGRDNAGAEVSVVLVDDPTICDLNRRFLKHNRTTDVMAFPGDGESADGRRPFLGEVVVSADTAAREAKARKRPAQTELLLYTVHGVLHLLGFDDQTVCEAERMHARERELLASIGLHLEDI